MHPLVIIKYLKCIKFFIFILNNKIDLKKKPKGVFIFIIIEKTFYLKKYKNVLLYFLF